MVCLTPPRIEQAWSVGTAETAYPQRLFNGEKMLPTRAPLTMRDSRALGFIFTWFLSVRDPCSVSSSMLLPLCSMERVSSSDSQRLVESRQEAQQGETAPHHFHKQNWELKNLGENMTLQLRETWFQFLLALLWDLGQFVWPLVPQSPCYGVGTPFPS